MKTKKLLALILSLALTASLGVPAFAEDTTGMTTLPYTGIDVSEHRGAIDWNSVKNSGMVQFAIIREGYGWENPAEQIDDQFEANYAGATSNGIPVGVYHYSYATTPAEAALEAQFCLNILKGRHLDYPVFYDLETATQKAMTSEQITAIINTFCNAISNAGYLTGIYSGANMYKGNLNTPALDGYFKWVAHYGVDAPNYDGAFAIWQYTSKGSVPGINGNVDMNYCLKDFSTEKPRTVAVATAKAADDNIASDTPYLFTLKAGKTYTFKFTPKSASLAPKFTMGNSSVAKIVSQKKIGNSYYVKIQGIKRATTSVYSTLGKEKPVARCVVTVA
jgi:GH25 family lysozyme M1 (1,4-beta-N-acetylmuramidase)